jgi:hypothetical protein
MNRLPIVLSAVFVSLRISNAQPESKGVVINPNPKKEVARL